MNPEELEAMRKLITTQTAKMAEPIDYADFERRGVISKAGAWYRVHVTLRELPEYVACKIYATARDSKGVKVKFLSDSKIQAGVKKLRKMGF